MSADGKVTLVFSKPGLRRCGDCQLCCKLMPMPLPQYNKPAGERCKHQKHGVGCAIYARRPASCAMWTCRWLVNDDTADLRRPDRSRYVIDVMPDFVTLRPDDGSEPYNVPVVQIWCDPRAPEAWRDPALLRYLDRRGQDGTAALIRFDNKRGITVFPPSMTGDTWREYANGTLRAEHTLAEKVAAISTAPKIVPKKEAE
jgi:hypothetical protein